MSLDARTLRISESGDKTDDICFWVVETLRMDNSSVNLCVDIGNVGRSPSETVENGMYRSFWAIGMS